MNKDECGESSGVGEGDDSSRSVQLELPQLERLLPIGSPHNVPALVQQLSQALAVQGLLTLTFQYAYQSIRLYYI